MLGTQAEKSDPSVAKRTKNNLPIFFVRNFLAQRYSLSYPTKREKRRTAPLFPFIPMLFKTFFIAVWSEDSVLPSRLVRIASPRACKHIRKLRPESARYDHHGNAHILDLVYIYGREHIPRSSPPSITGSSLQSYRLQERSCFKSVRLCFFRWRSDSTEFGKPSSLQKEWRLCLTQSSL